MTEQELTAEQERIAGLLFRSRAGDAVHRGLEEQFNSLGRQLFVLQRGATSDYRYKHDIRHRFEFREERDASGVREQIASTAQGQVLLPVEDVINWRNTKVGAAEDKRARGASSRYELDDAGHLIALEFGTDPSDQRNLADQNYIQNETGTWRKHEEALGEWLAVHTGCSIRVTVFYNRDQYGRRSTYRKMEANGADAQGRSVAFLDNVVFGNFQSNAGSRAAGWEQNRSVNEALKQPFVPVRLQIVK